MPQRLDDHVQEAIVVPCFVRQASDQVQAVEVILQPLPSDPSCPRDLPFVACKSNYYAQLHLVLQCYVAASRNIIDVLCRSGLLM